MTIAQAVQNEPVRAGSLKYSAYVEENAWLYKGNCLDVLPDLKPHTFDSVIFSPPFWGKIDYGHPEQIGLECRPSKYISRMLFIFEMLYSLTKPGGQAMVNIADTWNGESAIVGNGRSPKESVFTGQATRRKTVKGFQEKELLGISDRLTGAARQAGWVHRSTYIWDKGSSRDSKPGDRARQTHEYILHFLKPKKGDRRPTAAYWDDTHLPSSVIRINAVSSKGHPCPWPVELAERLIKATCPPEGKVLDPFMGEGNTGVAAISGGYKFTGVELNPKTFDRAVERVSSVQVPLIG